MSFSEADTYHDIGYVPLPESKGGWRKPLDDESVRKEIGLDVSKLDAAFALCQTHTKNGGLFVVRNGWLAYQRWFGLGHPQAACNLGSCGKSFTSIAMGIFVHEHPELFPDGLDQNVYTPDYLPPAAFPLCDPRKADITLGQLLAFSAGIRGNNPSYVAGKDVTIDPIGPDGWQAMVDEIAWGERDDLTLDTVRSTATLWCDPGAGYSYATSSIHLVSVILRRLAGMELQQYLDLRLGRPLGWGQWGYGYKYAAECAVHTPGGGGITLRPADMLRFGYLLLREGRWGEEHVVPAEYVRHCSHKSPYNPHYPYSLQFNVNTDGQWPEVPRDAFWKTGSGGHCIFVVPSLDLVVWKLGGRDGQYGEEDTGEKQSAAMMAETAVRQNWKATIIDADAYKKTLQLVVTACQQ